jgi:hypothetical protein
MAETGTFGDFHVAIADGSEALLPDATIMFVARIAFWAKLSPAAICLFSGPSWSMNQLPYRHGPGTYVYH